MRSVLTLWLVAACQGQPSKLDTPSRTSAPLPAADDLEGRIARLERRLDRVIAALDQALPPAEPDPAEVYAIAVDKADPVQGPADAKITIVEGFEFLCPFCFVVNPTIDAILAKHPRDVRLVSKYLVIHGEPAIAPGMAACAAAHQGKFKEMKAALWSHLFTMENDEPRMHADQAAVDNMETIAASAGLDVGKFKPDLVSDECATWLRGSAETLRGFGVSATPAFFINGRYVGGAQPPEVFDKLIDEELAKADQAIAAGVPAADYYERVVMTKGAKKVKGRFED
jgi:protein-disulfide isomerase